jgi:hypothetical protein
LIKIETKIITSQKEEESKVAAMCDFCSKELELTDEVYYKFKKDSKIIKRYVGLTTSHNDWGNDSEDSVETYQFCCIKCCLDWILSHEKALNTDTREFNIVCQGVY